MTPGWPPAERRAPYRSAPRALRAATGMAARPRRGRAAAPRRSELSRRDATARSARGDDLAAPGDS